MRLACDGCDKVYVVDEELVGRAFRMRCKRCGQVISVAPTPTPAAANGPAEGGTMAAADDFLDFSRELQDFCAELERGPESRSTAATAMQARPPALPSRPAAAAVAMTSPVPVHPVPPPIPPRPPRLRSVPPPPDPAEDAPSPFAAEESPAPAPPVPVVDSSAPARAEVPPAPGRRRARPAAWIGGAALLAAGFLAYLSFGSAGHGGTPTAPVGRPEIAKEPVAVAPSSPARPERPPEEAGSAPAALPVPAPAVAAEVPPSGSTPASPPGPPAPGTRRKADRRERARSTPPAVATATPSPPESSPTSATLPAPGATPPGAIRTAPASIPHPDLPPRDEQQLQAALAGYAASFDGCVAQAWRDEPDLLANPRPVVLTMTVRPSGRTAYPTLDDAQLSGTALGACLKRQSAALVFPEAGGEPVRARLSLVLGR